jgi:hypothetical protein
MKHKRDQRYRYTSLKVLIALGVLTSSNGARANELNGFMTEEFQQKLPLQEY